MLIRRSQVSSRSGSSRIACLSSFEDGAVVAVDAAVAGDHGAGEGGVALGQGVEALADLGQGLGGQRFERLRGRGRPSGSSASFLTRLAMCRARSPMRSRSPLILSTAATRRRSEATGWCSARTFRHSRSIWTSQRSTARSSPLDLVGQVGPAVAEGADAPVQRVLDDRRELEDPAPEPLQVAQEVPAQGRPARSSQSAPGPPPRRVASRPSCPSPARRELPRRRRLFHRQHRTPGRADNGESVETREFHENFTFGSRSRRPNGESPASRETPGLAAVSVSAGDRRARARLTSGWSSWRRRGRGGWP